MKVRHARLRSLAMTGPVYVTPSVSETSPALPPFWFCRRLPRRLTAARNDRPRLRHSERQRDISRPASILVLPEIATPPDGGSQ
ncbi:MAG: hypothetical protein AB1457_12275 [Chloroflexota bacterium]